MMALRASSAECISNWDEASVGSGDILSVFGQTGGCLGADLCFFAAFFRGALTSGPGFRGYIRHRVRRSNFRKDFLHQA